MASGIIVNRGMSLEQLRVGVTTRLTTVPAWKRAADFLFVQVSWSVPERLAIPPCPSRVRCSRGCWC